MNYQFQYRKRYGLHAIWFAVETCSSQIMFQYRKRYGLHAISKVNNYVKEQQEVSIPQAVWIACNCTVQLLRELRRVFQYRKRYGLHAI